MAMTRVTRTGIIGVAVSVIGVLTLVAPGGWDWLSVFNIWMGGLLIGLELAARWVGR